MSKERRDQDIDRYPRDALEAGCAQGEAEPTRRSFLKRSAVLLVYVAPLIETFAVDDAEGKPKKKISPTGMDVGSSDVPQPPSTLDEGNDSEKDGGGVSPKWGTRF